MLFRSADGDRHDRKGTGVQTLRHWREISKASLEGSIEMKAEQDLGAKDQETRFIKRHLDPFVIGAAHGFSSQSVISSSATQLGRTGRLS